MPRADLPAKVPPPRLRQRYRIVVLRKRPGGVTEGTEKLWVAPRHAGPRTARSPDRRRDEIGLAGIDRSARRFERLLAADLLQVLDLRCRVVDAGAGHVGRPLRRQEVAHLALRLRPSRLGKVVLHPPAVRFPPLGAVIGAELLARPRAVLEGLCGRLALELQPDRVGDGHRRPSLAVHDEDVAVLPDRDVVLAAVDRQARLALLGDGLGRLLHPLHHLLRRGVVLLGTCTTGTSEDGTDGQSGRRGPTGRHGWSSSPWRPPLETRAAASARENPPRACGMGLAQPFLSDRIVVGSAARRPPQTMRFETI